MTTELEQSYRITGDGADAIAASIEAGVEAGHLAPGTALPSVRELARDLGVSPTTVATAYRDLKHRGVVRTHDRSRTVVSHRPPLAVRPAPELPEGVADLASGNPDPALLPDLAAAVRRLELPARVYGEEAAVPELLALAAAAFTADGIATDHLAVVSGALDGLERVLLAALRPGDRIGVEDPGYTGVLDLCRALGLTVVPVAVDDAGLLPDALEAALAGGLEALAVTPRAQNPTGATLDPARADELRAVLDAAPDVLVVEDDHAGDVAGAPLLSLTPGRQRWAVVRSLSKPLGPDLRVAILAADRVTATRVLGRQRVGCGWVSHVLQRLAAEVWAGAERDGTVAGAAAAYRRRREALLAALGARGLVAHGRSGLNVWVEVAEEAALVAALLRRGWAVQPGEPYRVRSGPGLRITSAQLDPADADRLAADLADLLEVPRHTRRG